MAYSVEASTFTTILNITVNGTHVIVFSESGSKEYYVNSTGNFTQTVEINRGDTCDEFSPRNLSMSVNELKNEVRAQNNYYNLYLSCYSENNQCQTSLKNKGEVKTYNSEWEQCVSEKSLASATSTKCQGDFIACTTALETSRTQTKEAKDNTMMFIVGSLAIGGGGVWYFLKRKEKKDDADDLKGY